jgi:hypothetical protein
VVWAGGKNEAAVTTCPQWGGAQGEEMKEWMRMWKRWRKGVLLGGFYRVVAASRGGGGGETVVAGGL